MKKVNNVVITELFYGEIQENKFNNLSPFLA